MYVAAKTNRIGEVFLLNRYVELPFLGYLSRCKNTSVGRWQSLVLNLVWFLWCICFNVVNIQVESVSTDLVNWVSFQMASFSP
jgi:hypothetical protein